MKFVVITTLCLVGLATAEFLKKKPGNSCYTCLANGKEGPCGDPFLLDRKVYFQKDCRSGWCLKVEVGIDRPFSKRYQSIVRDVGVGYIMRKCMKFGTPDGKERCGYMNYEGIDSYVCFCKGNFCNGASPKNISIATSVFVAIVATFINL